jgi:Xaa-Pro aminopeptidase
MSGTHAGGAETRRDAVEARLDLLRDGLARHDLRAAFLETRRTFAWLTAGGSNHVVLESETGVAGILVTPREAIVLTSGIERDRIAAEEIDGLGFELEAVDWWLDDGLAEAARRRAGGTIARDADVEPFLVDLRSRLSPLDRDRLAVIGGIAAAAVQATLDAAEPGMTEHELAADLVGRLAGSRAPVVLVAADDRIPRFRHPIPSDTPARRRVMLVLVAERWGLHAAITRFREFEPLDDDTAARFAAVTEVEAAMHRATRPGATLGTVFGAAQAAYAEQGHPDAWREHHQGGTIAYQGRERIATPGDRTRIEPGMAFAWNPSIAGVKVEDTFILEEDGSRRLVTVPPG